MATRTEFHVFYQTHLQSKLVEFEKQRQTIVKRLKPLFYAAIIFIVLLIPFIWAIVSGYIVTDELIGSGLAVFIISAMIMVIWALSLYNWVISPYKLNFKKEIIGGIVALVDRNLIYEPQQKIPLEEFRTSRLFENYTVNRWKGEDYVEGTINQIRVKFSEVAAERYRYDYDENHGARGHYEAFFEGLFFIFNFNLSFQGVTLISPDVAERLLGGLGKWLQSSTGQFTRRQLVNLDDPDVEQEFVVYSDNPIMARYVLSPQFMRRLLAFQHRLQKQVLLSFVNGKMYMAIFVNKDLFEPPLFKTVLNFHLIREFFEYMQLGEEIVEELGNYLNNPTQFNRHVP